MAARFVVGIDLGTTHTVVAYAELVARGSAPKPKIFSIPQLVTLGATEARPLLPSSLYAPLTGEIEGDPPWIVGEAAKRRGAETSGRSIASAKSWLSHAAVDRTAPILPWGQTEEVTKLSPVDASAIILVSVHRAWNEAHPEAPLAEQHVVLTLPASFDEVARQLTLKAAEEAGLLPTLLEEPTAAFYDALEDKRAVEKLIKHGERSVLVCDVGGGTTDLSLMTIARAAGEDEDDFEVKRVAVGRHILLGGDNMDLALAHLVEPRLGGTPLEAADLGQLVGACRAAKEQLLGDGDGDASEAVVSVLGRGSRLIGGTRSAKLTREDVETVVMSGFFPAIEAGEAPPPRRSAIVAFGLPYERDPAITRHIQLFLDRHQAKPNALLLNGGVFHSPQIVAAITKQLGDPPIIANRDPDLAVARGAVRFGLARLGYVYRIESGASRGYYVGLAADGERRAVCILPRGAKEGVHHEAAGRSFEILVGKSVRFDLYANDVAKHEAGAVVAIEGDDYERLPPVVTHLPPGEKKETHVRVTLGGELLPTGQLALAATADHRRFDLEFQLRGGEARSMAPPPPSIAPTANRTAAPSSRLEEASAIVDKVFGKKGDASPREVKDVVRDLEKTLGDRLTWTMGTCRAVADRLLLNPGGRRRSVQHERAFFMLLGFSLRPGFGDPGDPGRISNTFPLFDGRLGFPEAQCWQQFFIAWRRIAGGLDERMQVVIRDAMDPVIAPKEAKLKQPKRMPEHTDELVTMLGSLERAPVARRVQLGDWLLERTWSSDDPRLWSAIGRIGARVPLYASLHHVVPQKSAETWVERLLRADWKTTTTAPHAAVQLARVTGDRARDISDRLRGEVAKKLAAVNAKPEWVAAVTTLAEMNEDDRVAILGEGLPLGLRLAT